MLRRISTLVASAAVMIGLAIPATASLASPTAPHVATHNFTVPGIKNHNVVTAWGWYKKLSPARVEVHLCARQTGRAFAVGALALAYKTNGANKNLGAVVIQQKIGTVSCGTKFFVFYTAHLKVHVFIGSGGRIIATGPVKKIY
jgi:hypothetical protein